LPDFILARAQPFYRFVTGAFLVRGDHMPGDRRALVRLGLGYRSNGLLKLRD
jgi:hypothetical protein